VIGLHAVIITLYTGKLTELTHKFLLTFINGNCGSVSQGLRHISTFFINLRLRCGFFLNNVANVKQESSAGADKPARRESMPKIAPIRRAYNVVTDNTGLSIRLAVVASEICEIPRNSLKIQTYRVQGHPRSSILVAIESAYVLSY